jgi:hypothetical protein
MPRALACCAMARAGSMPSARAPRLEKKLSSVPSFEPMSTASAPLR